MPPADKTYDFLCVDDYLRSPVAARALQTAFGCGLIDRLSACALSLAEIAEKSAMASASAELLIDILTAEGVCAKAGGAISLSPGFLEALAYRDLLEAKLYLCALSHSDIYTHFSDWLDASMAAAGQSEVFSLFRYDRCLELTLENLQATSRWVNVTTALTRYESRAFIAETDFLQSKLMMDIGGNSGEFARRICEAGKAERACVIDLPVVCEIGKAHVADTPQARSIDFIPADMRQSDFPSGADLITFKSVLHDWPDEEAGALIDKAVKILPPGGRIAIFERRAHQKNDALPLDFSQSFNLVFAAYYRDPDFYTDTLKRNGLTLEIHKDIMLDWPFTLTIGRKP